MFLVSSAVKSKLWNLIYFDRFYSDPVGDGKKYSNYKLNLHLDKKKSSSIQIKFN